MNPMNLFREQKDNLIFCSHLILYLSNELTYVKNMIFKIPVTTKDIDTY